MDGRVIRERDELRAQIAGLRSQLDMYETGRILPAELVPAART